jgi:hypothetical protein
MKIIKNSGELAKLVDENKDLFLKDEDVRIEYQFTREELRDIYCQNLYLENDCKRFDFNGRDFNGWDFNGGKVSYYAFFNCIGSIKCESIEGRRTPHSKPVCLDGKLEIKPKEEEEVAKAIKLLEEKGKLKDGKILTNTEGVPSGLKH